MNVPPTDFTPIMPDDLRDLVVALFTKADVSDVDATLIAHLLVATDLRGVFSHGTRQTSRYVRQFLNGELNPRPAVRVVGETETTATIDGDRGLGHIASHRAACLAVEKAKAHGLGAAVTRNHGHFGAAGKYSRMALDADCVGFAVSACLRHPAPGQPVSSAAGSSPMSFAIPAGAEPPLVLDMACRPDRPRDDEDLKEMFARMPSTFFKFLGLASISHVLGGIMAGITLLEGQDPGMGRGDVDGALIRGANQGAFICAVDIARFMPIDTFKREMDEYVRMVRTLRPFPGYDRADLPGGLEWERAREWSSTGIPVSPGHRAGLEGIAGELGVDVPWGE